MPLKIVNENGRQKEVCVLSYSSYSVYEQCPKRYYREKILKEQPKEKDETYTIPGRIVHDAAGHFFETGSLERFDPEYLKNELQKMGEMDTVDYIKAYGSYDKALDLLLKSAENLKTFVVTRDPTKRILSEKWFGDWENPLSISDNLALQGAADLIEVDENGLGILYDFKTSWNTRNLSRDQLILYVLAAKLKWDINILMCSFFLLPTNKQNYFSFTDADTRELLNRLQKAADEIIAGKEKLECKKGFKCKFCPFMDDCEMTKVESELKRLPEGTVSFNFGASL